jgi:hypothetical protein
MYESYYLRAVSPERAQSLWIRHTVHKRPGAAARGSIWLTFFDRERGAPFMYKVTSPELGVPPGGWITIGGTASLGPGLAEGGCGASRWRLRLRGTEPPLRHLRPAWLYRAPLPRTKLTSPLPAASFDGELELPDREPLRLREWPGMVGHNWGAEHAARWIWLHGCLFEEDTTAWLDLALGRVAIAGRLTPWIANGALSLGGRRLRLGGAGARARVRESVQGLELSLGGRRGGRLKARVEVPPGTSAGWRYADPNGGAHDVANCSIAKLELDLVEDRAGPRTLRSGHGGAYELGMLERDHGIPVAPFADG